MPIDLRGFTTPEQDWKGLSDLTDTLKTEQAAKAKSQQEAAARENAGVKFFSDYIGDKNKYTGTKFDPVNAKLTNDATQTAYNLIRQGADWSTVMQTISPMVGQIQEYSNAAKQFSETKKQQLDALQKSENAVGIDFDKLSAAIDNAAFPNGDVTKYNPNRNYIDEALNSDVYNEGGFDQMYKKAKSNTQVLDVQRTNARKGSERTKEEITAENYLVPDRNEKGDFLGMVPKYQIATDEGKEIIGQFHTDKGIVDAPIRVLDKDVFDAMNISAKGYVLQEAKKYAKEHNIPLSDTRVELLARSIAYDKLNQPTRKSVSHKLIESTKENPIKITVAGSGSGKPTKAELKAEQSKGNLFKTLDLREPDSEGNIDVTDIMSSVIVRKNSKGEKTNQGTILYNPERKEFLYQNQGVIENKPVYEVATIAETANPDKDVSFVRSFEEYAKKEKPKEENKQDKGIFGSIKSFLGIGKKNENKPKGETKGNKIKGTDKKLF